MKGYCETSLCGHCETCTCSWLQKNKQVDGWTAEPSKIYENGWAVHQCPEYKPFPKRKTDHLEVKEPLGKRCRVCGAYIAKDNPRKKFCSGECERKWDRLRAARKRAGLEGV